MDFNEPIEDNFQEISI